MLSLQTTITIHAPASVVWRVLTDFKQYPEWNPMLQIEGKAQEGTYLKNTMLLEEGKPQVFKPKVIVATPDKELRWRGMFLSKLLFSGEHYFILDPTSTTTVQLTHGEDFRGLLAAPVFRRIAPRLRQRFEAVNQALKKRAETG